MMKTKTKLKLKIFQKLQLKLKNKSKRKSHWFVVLESGEMFTENGSEWTECVGGVCRVTVSAADGAVIIIIIIISDEGRQYQ